MFKYPIIDLHATWLVINGIQGCPNKCKYCFLNGVNLTGKKPCELVTPKQAIKLLLESQYYNVDIPICIGTQTDLFSTPKNVEYAINLLEEIKLNNIKNPIIFITKCLVPDFFIEKIKEVKKNNKIIFFLSYSGLEKDIEKGINKENIKKNFVNLFDNGIDIIHYWRPFVPQNSTKRKILEVYNFVKKYSRASVAIGLKVQENFIDKIDFWKELSDNPETINAESIWTERGYNYIWGNKSVVEKKYPIYQTTSCALALVLGKCDRNAFFNRDVCKNINNCPESQREICKTYLKRSNITKEYILKTILKLKGNIDINNVKVKIDYRTNIIDIEGIELSMKDFTYLTQITCYTIRAKKDRKDYYWNTSVNNSKQMFI